MKMYRRPGDEQGASLVLVLALIGFLALLLPAILGLVSTGSRVTVPVTEDRRALYAANSALDAAVAQALQDPYMGRAGNCPTQQLRIEEFDVSIGCQPVTRMCDLDRLVYYTATVSEQGGTLTRATAAAEVAYRYQPDLTQRTEVRRWNPDATAPITASTLPPCPVGASTTTTSSTVPEQTTTTTIPEATTTTTSTTTTTTPTSVLAEWSVGQLAIELRGSGPNVEWLGFGEVRTLTGERQPIRDATVTVRIRVREDDGKWKTRAEVTGVSNEVGSVTFHGPWLGTKSKDPDGVQLQILTVSANGATTVLPLANSFRCGFRSGTIDLTCPTP
jgi:hypothetical protein